MSRLSQLALWLSASLIAAPLQAQTRFAVDTAASLAWWQIQPNWDHLWATTCPQDTAWQPGGAHTARYHYRADKDPLHGHNVDQKAMARTPVPLYPRAIAMANCTPAVRGEIVANDTVNWRGVRGMIVIMPDDLVTGLDFRDTFAHKHLLETHLFPDIRFVIDSLVDVKPGDTLEATAMGTLQVHGEKTSWGVPLKVWHEPLGLRVTGQFAFPVSDLVEVYKFPRAPLWMGVGAKWWKWFHLGIDAIMVPEGGAVHAGAR